MMIELHKNGKRVKIWQVDYQLGPYPLSRDIMFLKSIEFENIILNVKVQAGPLIYDSPYEMYAVVRSKLNTETIPNNEWHDFIKKYPPPVMRPKNFIPVKQSTSKK